jgi:hypothetical protein
MNVKKIDVFTKEEITALVAEQHKVLDEGLAELMDGQVV